MSERYPPISIYSGTCNTASNYVYNASSHDPFFFLLWAAKFSNLQGPHTALELGLVCLCVCAR